MNEYYDIDYGLGPYEKDILNRVIDCFASNIPVYAGPDKIIGLGKTITGKPSLFTNAGIVLFETQFLAQIGFGEDKVSYDDFFNYYYKEATTGKYLSGLVMPVVKTVDDADAAIAALEAFKKSKSNGNNGQGNGN